MCICTYRCIRHATSDVILKAGLALWVTVTTRRFRSLTRFERNGDFHQSTLIDRLARERALKGRRSLFKCDDDLRPGVSLFCVGHGVGRSAQRVASIDHRDHFSSRDQFSKRRQVFSIDIRNEEFEVLS
jgi:hypothetical protein